MQFLASYTYGKLLDQSSSLSEQINPLNYKLSRALSSFDIAQNFAGSYNYELPLGKLFHRANRLTAGWVLASITHFSTGFPVTLFNNGDTSLLGTQPNGVNSYGVDLPNYTPGPLDLNGNPRNGLPYFNTSLFGIPLARLVSPPTASSTASGSINRSLVENFIVRDDLILSFLHLHQFVELSRLAGLTLANDFRGAAQTN